ncbi:unnamed protein product [Trifolium pratense]|uniref:Uncharacterized protein n=1 Tax=Trifolium pratense TaxID=57577 RepID=A0ACB0IYC4_TRIPR|nr:unnamed protein product [Trifolium pratense]
MLRCDDNSKMKLALDARSLGRRILGRLSLCFMTWWMKILSLTWRLVKVYEAKFYYKKISEPRTCAVGILARYKGNKTSRPMPDKKQHSRPKLWGYRKEIYYFTVCSNLVVFVVLRKYCLSLY